MSRAATARMEAQGRRTATAGAESTGGRAVPRPQGKKQAQ